MSEAIATRSQGLAAPADPSAVGPASTPAPPRTAGSVIAPLRTCMFTAESQKGHARYARELLLALAEVGPSRGVSVSLVTSENLAEAYRTSKYPIHAILPPLADRNLFRTQVGWGISRVSHYFRRDRTFLRWVKSQSDLDLIHFQEYTPWLAPIHFPWLRRQGLAVVSTVHNIANHGHASHTYMRFSQRCWRRAWRSCSALLVHTPGLRVALGEFLGADHPPIYVTPHGVWQERSSPPVPVVAPAPGERARLLFFGVIRSNKGLHVLLRAMAHLPGCVLTVAGEADFGPYQDRIRELVAMLPAGRVEMVTRFIAESEIAAYFDRSHLVILPYTDFASQSGVLHQALAHHRPVVATAVGGLGESVREWGIGEVVPPNDDRALADGIMRAIELDRFQAAAAAVARESEARTWTKQAEATLDVYRAIVP